MASDETGMHGKEKVYGCPAERGSRAGRFRVIEAGRSGQRIKRRPVLGGLINEDERAA